MSPTRDPRSDLQLVIFFWIKIEFSGLKKHSTSISIGIIHWNHFLSLITYVAEKEIEHSTLHLYCSDYEPRWTTASVLTSTIFGIRSKDLIFMNLQSSLVAAHIEQ